MSASIKSSDFCREPRAIQGTISEVAGMPMPRTEGAILEQRCCKIGSKCAAEEVRTITWDSGTYFSMGDFEGCFVAVTTRLLPGSSHLLIQPQSRLRHSCVPSSARPLED
jgi:hypothetical protein